MNCLLHPDFHIPGSGSKISAGVVAAIVVSVIFAVFLIVGILWWKGCLFKKDTMDEGMYFRYDSNSFIS